MTTGQADGAELMIWINRHGTCCHLIQHAPIVRLAGHRYYLMHWRPCSRKWHICFNYIQFRLVRPTWRVDNLRLAPFVRKAEQLKLVRPWWFLENVGAGFEIWKGGKGSGDHPLRHADVSTQPLTRSTPRSGRIPTRSRS